MSFIEKFTGPKLQNTDPDAFGLLQTKMQEVASKSSTEGTTFTDKDIKQAAFHIALKAERAGTPYTTESLQAMSDEDMSGFAEALGLRMQSVPGSENVVHISDQSGEVIGTATSKKEVMDITEGQRESA
ncbi:MAG: hypothetical protein AAB472_02900 [Patescibacteria group bacterium]